MFLFKSLYFIIHQNIHPHITLTQPNELHNYSLIDQFLIYFVNKETHIKQFCNIHSYFLRLAKFVIIREKKCYNKHLGHQEVSIIPVAFSKAYLTFLCVTTLLVQHSTYAMSHKN